MDMAECLHSFSISSVIASFHGSHVVVKGETKPLTPLVTCYGGANQARMQFWQDVSVLQY